MAQKPDIKTILNDPEFQALPESEKMGVLRAVDPDYAMLPEPEQIKVVTTGFPKPEPRGAVGIRGPLSWGEWAEGKAKQVARAAPEMVGSVGGGIAGGIVGAPGGPPGVLAGRMIGSGIGAGAGQGMSQALSRLFPTVFGGTEETQVPKTPAESLGKIGEAAAWGAGTEGLGGAIGGTLLKMFPKTLKPSQQAVMGVLEREKVPYTAGNIRPGGGTQITENLMRGTLLGGKVMSDFDIKQAQRLHAFKTRLFDAIGPEMSKSDVGKMLQGSVETRSKELFDPGGLFDTLYKQQSDLYPAFVDTRKIRAAIIPLRDKVMKGLQEGRIPSGSSPESPSKFVKILNDLSNYGTKEVQTGVGPNGTPIMGRSTLPVTYADVWEDKKMIDGIIRSMPDDPLRTQAKGLLKQLHTTLDNAMEDAARPLGGDKSIRKINAAYSEAKKLFETESLVSDIGKMDPEKIVGRFFSGDRVTPERDLLRALPAKDRAKDSKLMGVLRRRTLENLVAPSTKVSDEGTEILSGKMFETRFRKEKDVLKELFTPEQMAGLEEFIQASKTAQSAGTMLNPASGRQLLAYSQMQSGLTVMGGLLGFAGGGGLGTIAGGATSLIAPKVLANMLTHPNVARHLAKGFKMGPRAATASDWLARTANLIRMNSIGDEDNPTR